jgi:hypothetical protein
MRIVNLFCLVCLAALVSAPLANYTPDNSSSNFPMMSTWMRWRGARPRPRLGSFPSMIFSVATV